MLAEQKIFEIRKKRDFGAVVGDTFVYFRRHFKPLIRSLVIIAGPFLLLAAIYRSIAQANAFGITPSDGIYSTVVLNTLFSSLFMMLAMVLLIAVTHAYVKIDIEKNSDEEIKTDEVWQVVKQNIWKSIGIIVLGFVFFALVGGIFALAFYAGGAVLFGFTIFLSIFFLIYLVFRLSFIYPAALLDDYSSLDSFSRSWSMTNGYFWNNFGIMFIFGMLVGAISFFAAIPTLIFTIVGALHGANSDVNPIWKFIVISIQTVGTFIALIGYALPFIAYILQYYSAVEKNEGVGLLQKIENMSLTTEDNQRWGEETY